MNLIINIILWILTLIALTMAYGIIIRTAKNLRKGAIFLFLALLILTIKWIFDLINSIKPVITISLNTISIIFILLLVLGLYEILKTIKTVNHESKIKVNKKLKLKKRKR